MKIQLRICYFISLFLFLAYDGHANHVMGGNLELKATGKTPGNYKLILKLYIDLTNAVQTVPIEVVEIRRRENSDVMATFQLDLVSSKLVVYENETCTEKGRLKTQLLYYEKDITLELLKYADPKGYYLLWSSCCRNASIINIVRAGNTEIQFKTNFPPLVKLGKPFLDSSPSFNELDGAYLCIGEPFYFPFDATDPDGDELKYSMRDPLSGIGAPGGLIPWVSGYSATNAIPGTPPLNIDAKTGELYVVPNRLGLFMFSVLVEEFRNGELIGSVHRDFQMNVVDCASVTPPEPKVLVDGQPVSEVSVCEGKTVLLSAAVASNEWNYQWKKNGKNIKGGNGPNLQVLEAGEFQLVTSLVNVCSRSAKSDIVKVNVTKASFALKAKGPLRICEDGGTLQIDASAGNSTSYLWFRNGSLITGSTSSLTVTSPGAYWATASETNLSCSAASDTLTVTTALKPPLTLSAPNGKTSFCAGDSILLQPTQRSDYTYAWFRDDQILTAASSLFYVDIAGTYSVAVTDSAGCVNTSNKIEISLLESIVAKLSAVDPMCGADHNPVALQGTPEGGIFSGRGVVGESFDPRQAGVGTHEVRYTVSAPGSCPVVTAKQLITVWGLPVATVGDDIGILEGTTGYIGGTTVDGLHYNWTPPDA